MTKKNESRMKMDKDYHHIIPKSKGGTEEWCNKKLANKYEHQVLYHGLFKNMTPDEIINYLVKKWWNGQWHWIDIAKEKYR